MNEGHHRKCYAYSPLTTALAALVHATLAALAAPFVLAPIWAILIMVQARQFLPTLLIISLWSAVLGVSGATVLLNMGPAVCVTGTQRDPLECIACL